MIRKNRYLVRARISEAKFRQFLRAFALDLTAKQIAKSTRLNRNTVNRLCRVARERIAEHCETQSPFRGTVEVDESYFGPRRIRGKRGRGAGRKTIVFGILKRKALVYTRIVPNAERAVLLRIIKQKVRSGSTIHSDGWTAYDGLVDVGYRKHYRVHHGENEFARGRSHINGIENFWGLAKVRLAKFRGMHPQTFYLHLKECEFRFNWRNHDLYAILLLLFKKNSPINSLLI
jgi:transposase-like protein